MSLRDLHAYRSRLDNLFERGKALQSDIELQAQWARYLCIMVSGFVEVSVREIYQEYARTKSSPFVASFVQKKMEDFQNPKMEKILELSRMFSPEWETKLRARTEGELKDAVDSIVANRHRIAHGRDVGVSYAQIVKYYRKALEVVKALAAQCEVDI